MARSNVWLLLPIGVLVATGCGEGVDSAPKLEGGYTVDQSLPGMPCDISRLLNTRCNGCHGAPLKNSAPIPLVSRANLLERSQVDPSVTVGARSALRMRDTALSMPPARYPQPTEEEKAAFETWVAEGMPDGRCGEADAGVTVIEPVDAGPAPTVCSSNTFWTRGNDGSASMNPGFACRSCHLGQNFEGQNPNGDSERGRAFFFMGTVFPSLHEKNLCRSVVPSSGGTVEIIDAQGKVAATLMVNASGNFMSTSTRTTIAMPYTARVKANGRVRAMTTPQTDGDCNTCHTEQGRNDAPGRIVWP
ncbi:MAG: hypothetical protein K1X64_07475 [Myxococcaceae bacterium]|nr:hypothetical protein [Myxococcaceae bacterium]